MFVSQVRKKNFEIKKSYFYITWQYPIFGFWWAKANKTLFKASCLESGDEFLKYMLSGNVRGISEKNNRFLYDTSFEAKLLLLTTAFKQWDFYICLTIGCKIRYK